MGLMDYIPYSKIKYYDECAPLVEGLGYKLVDLKIVPAKTITKISAIITGTDPAQNIGVNDCAKVHRVLLARLEALLGTEETTMELTSPGIEHNSKNAAEFGVFTGRRVRVWDKTVNDWVGGTIMAADDKSVTLKSEEGSEKTITFENIAKAKFVYNI
jgi:ribosome maturation factor RimP